MNRVTTALSNRMIGRLSGILHIGFGGLIAVLMLLPVPLQVNRGGALAVCAFVIAMGAFALRAPWDDWPRARTLWLTVGALAAMTAGGFLAFDAVSYAFAAFVSLIFMWIGIAQPPGTPLLASPLVLASLMAVYLHATNDWLVTSRNALLVVVVGVVLGEFLAWLTTMLGEAEQRDALHIAKQRALLDAATTLAYQPEYETASYLVARMGGELMEANAAAVFITDDSGLTLIGSWPEPAEPVHLPAARVERILARTAFGEAATVPADPTCPVSQLLGATTLYAVPIRGETDTLGLLVTGFDDAAPTITDFMEGLAHTYAQQAGLAFERVWAAQHLLDDSLRDELTGVGNRRHISALLAHIQPGDALVMLDLDHFKEVNDRFGHAAGDEVLRHLGTFLREQLRESDSVARYGGEEFLLVLRRANDGALEKAWGLLRLWQGTTPLATFSAGVAVHDLERTPGRTLELADLALYAAKDRGRNRVESAADVVPVGSNQHPARR